MRAQSGFSDRWFLVGAGVIALIAVIVALNFGPKIDSSSSDQRDTGFNSSGYSAGYSLGHMMGLKDAGSPTDDALHSMSAIHAPDDQLQFRIGYRNGLLAGQQQLHGK